jgi:ribosomal protein L37AE/L43A
MNHYHKLAHCPNCEKKTIFRYVGTQTYSPKVAQAAGYNTTQFTLWMCDQCQTTQLQPETVEEKQSISIDLE